MSQANTPIVLPVVEQDPYADEYTKAHRDGQAYMLEEVKPIIDKMAVELRAKAVEDAANSTRTAMTESGAPWLCRYTDLMAFADKIRRGEA